MMLIASVVLIATASFYFVVALGSSALPIFAFILPLLFSVILYSFTIRFSKFRRIIEDTPLAKIRSAAQGYNQLVGNIMPLTSPPMLAPLTKIPCGWYKYSITDDREQASKPPDGYISDFPKSDVSDDWILFNDGTGECFINPKDLRIYPTQFSLWQDKTPMPGIVPSNAHHHLNNQEKIVGDVIMEAGFSGHYHFREDRLDLNTPLYVIGMFQTIEIPLDCKNYKEIKELVKAWSKNLEMRISEKNINEKQSMNIQQWHEIQKSTVEEFKEKFSGLETRKINLISKEGLPSNWPFQISAIPIKTMNYFKYRQANFLLAFSIFYFLLSLLGLVMYSF